MVQNYEGTRQSVAACEMGWDAVMLPNQAIHDHQVLCTASTVEEGKAVSAKWSFWKGRNINIWIESHC
jgi:hypothetical protein